MFICREEIWADVLLKLGGICPHGARDQPGDDDDHEDDDDDDDIDEDGDDDSPHGGWDQHGDEGDKGHNW